MKHLVAKLLAQILTENVARNRKTAFLEINSTAKQMANLERRLGKLNRVLSNYYTDRKRHFLRLWYRKALDCVHETSKRNQLVENNVKFKREQRFFFLWRQAFLGRRKFTSGRVEASRMLFKIINNKTNFKLKHFLCKWRDYVEMKQSQSNFLYAVTERKYERTTRRSFVLWLSFCKRDKLLEKYECLSDIVT